MVCGLQNFQKFFMRTYNLSENEVRLAIMAIFGPLLCQPYKKKKPSNSHFFKVVSVMCDVCSFVI